MVADPADQEICLRQTLFRRKLEDVLDQPPAVIDEERALVVRQRLPKSCELNGRVAVTRERAIEIR